MMFAVISTSSRFWDKEKEKISSKRIFENHICGRIKYAIF